MADIEANQLRLKNLWDQAFREYSNTQQQIDQQTEDKKRKGIFSHRKDDTEKIVVSKPPLPKGMSVNDFKNEISRSQAAFTDMRMKNHKIFDVLGDMAGPIQVIGGQASAIGGMFSPAAPMVFSAVMYLFSTGKQVAADLDAMAELFYRCNEHIIQISLLVKARQLATELQDIIVGSLIAILDVCRISTYYVQRGRLKAFVLTLGGAGGDEAQAALAKLKDLAKGRDSTTIGATYVAVDELQEKSDRVLTGVLGISEGVSGISEQVLETQNMIMKKLSQISKEKSDDKQGNTAIGSAATLEKIKEDSRDALRTFLKPDFSITERFKELHRSTTPGTCEWIFEELIGDQTLQSWAQESKDTMVWIYSQSGSGKSHLAAKIAERFGPSNLLGDSDASKAAVAAYFFDYSGVIETYEQPNVTKTTEEKPEKVQEEVPEVRDNQCINEMLRTLCWQLCQDDKKYQTYLAERLVKLKKDIPRDASTPASSVWNSLFNIPYFIDLKGPPVAVIIDGVDNLSLADRSVFYDLLEQVAKTSATKNTPKLNFIILSQANLVKDEISVFEWSSKVLSISITEEKNLEDIETFMLASVQKSRKLRRALADKNFREEAVHRLAQTTHGVFEMATLLIKQLEQKDHVDLVDEVLEAPPENIQDILRQTVEHFGETHTSQDVEDLNSLLAWNRNTEFLDIRDKVAREFSAYFSIIGDHKGFTNTSDQLVLSEQNQKVKVAHASIATYFRSSKAADDAKLSNSIGTSRPAAHLRIARTCLVAMCSKNDPKKLRRPSHTEHLLTYAATNFYKHLAVARSLAQPAEKFQIAQLLIKAFRDEECIEEWLREASIWPTWFVANGAIDEVWAWINDNEIIKSLPKEDVEWIQKPDVCIQEKLLKPISIWFGKKLLQDLEYNINNSSMFYFIFLYGFKTLFEQPLAPLTKDTIHPYYMARNLSTDEVRQVMEWPGFEKTALWHTRLGYVLEDLKGIKEGISEWETAIKLNPDFGQAYFVLAYTHADEKDYDLAIKQMKESRRLKYNVEGGSSRRGAIFIADWQQARAEAQDPGEVGIQKGVKEALETLEDELEVFPNSFDLVAEYIKVASKAHLHRTVMAILRKLGSKLPEFLLSEEANELSVHQKIRRAGQYTHNVSLLKWAYETAIASKTELLKDADAQEADVGAMSVFTALASLYVENQEDEKALDIYEKILDVYEGDDHWLAKKARMQKAEICWVGALNRSGSSKERDNDFERLIQLEKQEHSPDFDTSRYHVGLLLGLYYRLRGDDETAKPFFKDRIALGLSLFEDEDKDNDYEAYSILYQSLTKAGDLKNGIAARSLYVQELQRVLGYDNSEPETTTDEKVDQEPDTTITGDNSSEMNDSKDQKNTVESNSNQEHISVNETIDPKDYPDTPWAWGMCDGVCGRNMAEYTENVHTCIYCLDVDFCNDCFPKHQEGALPYKLCNPDHEFTVSIGAPKNLPENLVKVGGEIKNRAEWLDGIRREWGLEVKGERNKA